MSTAVRLESQTSSLAHGELPPPGGGASAAAGVGARVEGAGREVRGELEGRHGAEAVHDLSRRFRA